MFGECLILSEITNENRAGKKLFSVLIQELV